jgi:hypothetical protein
MTVYADRRSSPEATPRDRTRAVATESGISSAYLWTATSALLALAASLAGLLWHDLYTGPASTAEMLRGYDLVTAAVVAPGIWVGTWMAHRRLVRAWVASASLSVYLVYTYAYYLFGTGFNDLFLLHAAVFATAVVALTLHMAHVDAAAFAARARTAPGVRGAAVVLAVLAVALGAMWVYFGLDNAFTGAIPPGSQLVETAAIVHLGMALDLTLLVPLYAVAAVLLWRRAGWGYALGAISLVAGVLHQLSYIVAMAFQAAADIPGAVSYDPAEPVIVLMYLLGAALLLRRPRTRL